MTDADRSTATETRAMDRPSWEIRPGIRFPNWSAIRSPGTEVALRDILDLLQIERCWDGYGGAEDRLRRLMLDGYGSHGRAPTVAALAEAASMSENDVRNTLARLRERDLVVLDADQDRVAGAYPFTDSESGHCVLFDGLVVHAMCAIDALGAASMYQRDATVHSRCRACDAAIDIETRNRGSALASYAPGSAVVWSGLQYADNCAATSLCTVIAFFCSDRHLEEWRAEDHPDIRGHRLSIEEAHEVGVAIFSPMLATAAIAERSP